jgi:protein dithiol oxidoreductase (disulfide-forming)
MVKALLTVVLLFAFGQTVAAEQSPQAGKPLKAGEDYELVSPPQPTADPSKVEVMEFFWYGCPHCLHFEPYINEWLKTKPANVVFVRQPAVFNARWGAHAKAFFTAESLGVDERMHADFFDAIQNKKMALESEDDLAKFFAAHDVKEEDFHKAYRSFAVDSKMRQAEGMAARYGVDGTPALIVNGKYRITGSLAKTLDNMIAITNTLIKQESAAKPAK